MKCLDYKTPEEAFNIEMEKLKLKTTGMWYDRSSIKN